MDYGYRLQMYGNDCYVTRVRPGTDAETKVHPGDQVLGYNKFNVNREIFWKMSYYFNSLAPQRESVLEIRDPSGQSRQLTIDAKVRELKKVLDLTGQDAVSYTHLDVYKRQSKSRPNRRSDSAAISASVFSR